jgi:hypothetical protein
MISPNEGLSHLDDAFVRQDGGVSSHHRHMHRYTSLVVTIKLTQDLILMAIVRYCAQLLSKFE